MVDIPTIVSIAGIGGAGAAMLEIMLRPIRKRLDRHEDKIDEMNDSLTIIKVKIGE
ncbi:unnamed protein product [marine sediment metagenome]|uniref:Uncharacterized protein n=1 Tax=marine sediment metagenome TaxID=412755 RepID=X1BNZ3_9ZZZZ